MGDGDSIHRFACFENITRNSLPRGRERMWIGGRGSVGVLSILIIPWWTRCLTHLKKEEIMGTRSLYRRGTGLYGAVRSTFVLFMTMGLIVGLFGAPAAQAKELRVGLQSFDDGTPGLDTYHTTNAQTQMQNSIHECLIEREPYSQPLKFMPALATSWKMIQPTVMEMKLRKGVKFHDGTIMNAEDVAFSLNRIWQRTKPAYDGAQGRFFYNFEKVEVVDPLTVRIHTKRPEPLIEVLLSDKCAGIVSPCSSSRL